MVGPLIRLDFQEQRWQNGPIYPPYVPFFLLLSCFLVCRKVLVYPRYFNIFASDVAISTTPELLRVTSQTPAAFTTPV